MTRAVRTHSDIVEVPLSGVDGLTFVEDPASGASVVFTGTVRDHALDDGGPVGAVADDPATATAPRVPDSPGPGRGTGEVRDVTGLEYESYVVPARAMLAELVDDVARRWPDLRAIYAVHRVGELAVGDPAVVVAVSSPHRDTAFEAGRHLIDTLKATVPIWKKEHWADGGHHWPGTD